MFSNKINTLTMLTYFKAIKFKVDKINSEIFMSDDYPTYYNAWVEVFGPAKHKLICAWHIHQSWNKNYTKIKCQSKTDKVKIIMKNLIQELDINKFNQQLVFQVANLKSDKDTKSFGEYIEQHYAKRKEMWAYCYRKGLKINTNMHLENMHR